jgi:hypothetical protein
MRGRILRNLTEQGRTRCQEYRDVSALRFATLHSESAKDVQVLGRAFVRSVTDCICAAFHPPCPTCTDNAVLLARVRVEGCDVTDVCSLVRRWVVSPRAAAYWFNADERFDRMARYCCYGYDRRKPSEREEPAPAPAPVEFMESTEDVPAPVPTAYAMSLTASIAEEPETAPEFAALAGAVGLTAREPIAARPFVQPEETVRTLEAKIGELERRLEDLSARGGEGVKA